MANLIDVVRNKIHNTAQTLFNDVNSFQPPQIQPPHIQMPQFNAPQAFNNLNQQINPVNRIAAPIAQIRSPFTNQTIGQTFNKTLQNPNTSFLPFAMANHNVGGQGQGFTGIKPVDKFVSAPLGQAAGGLSNSLTFGLTPNMPRPVNNFERAANIGGFVGGMLLPVGGITAAAKVGRVGENLALRAIPTASPLVGKIAGGAGAELLQTGALTAAQKILNQKVDPIGNLAVGIGLRGAGGIIGKTVGKALKTEAPILSNQESKTLGPILGRIDRGLSVTPQEFEVLYNTAKRVINPKSKQDIKAFSRLNSEDLAREIKTIYTKDQEAAYRQMPGFQIPGMGLVEGRPGAQQPIADVKPKLKLKTAAKQIDAELNVKLPGETPKPIGLPQELSQASKPLTDLSAGPLLGESKAGSQPLKQLEQVGEVKNQSKLRLESDSAKTLQNKSSDNIVSNSYNYNKLDQLYTESLDRYHPLSKLGKTAGKNDVIQNALTGHYGAGSIAKYHLDHELSPILKSVDTNVLRDAAIAQRDIELAGRGIKGSGKNLKVNSSPEVQAALKKVYDYQDNLVKEYLVKTGVMTEASYKAMKANNQSYVPFKRVMDNVDEFLGATPQKKNIGSVGSQNVIKGIKGSDREIVDPLESMVENTYKLVGLGQRQKVAKAIVSLKDDLPKGMITEFKGTSIGNNPVISLFENGKVKKYSVPREVEEAAKGLNEDQLGTLVKILSAPTKVFRATATSLNPEFIVPNIAHDVQSAFVNVGLNPLKFVSGLAHYIKKDAVYQEFLHAGGMTSQVSIDRKFLKESVGELSGKGMTIKKPSDLLRIMQNVGALSEQPTRIAAFEKVYNQALKEGKSIEEARSAGAYAAQESTVNFGRRGSKTQSLNAVYAFLNARAQGVDRLARSFKKDPAGTTARVGLVVMGPGMATYAWNQKFPEYYDERIVSKNDKQNNFIIMLPQEGPGGAKYVKIPKGDIGKLFNPVEAFMDYSKGKDSSVKNALGGVLQGFSPVNNVGDIIPTALRPIVEDKANKNFFFDKPIVPEYQKDLPAKDQFRSSTPSVYRLVGDKINVSPNRLQNLVEGYGTGWAKIGSMGAESLIKDPQYKKKDRGSADINTTPIARRFLGGAKYSPEEWKKIQHFANADKSLKSLSTQEKSAYDSLSGTKDPNDPQQKVYTYATYLKYPNVFEAKKQTALADAKNDLSKVDPLYYNPNAKLLMTYEQLNNAAPGSAEEKQFLKNNPGVLDLIKQRSMYFQANPITPNAKAPAYIQPPTPNAYVQAQLANKNYKDPQVQQYFADHLMYVNGQRTKQGLDPMDTFGNILGSKKYGGGGFGGGSSNPSAKLKAQFKSGATRTRKYKVKKIKAGKGKKFKVKKAKMARLNVNGKTSKAPSSLQLPKS